MQESSQFEDFGGPTKNRGLDVSSHPSMMTGGSKALQVSIPASPLANQLCLHLWRSTESMPVVLIVSLVSCCRQYWACCHHYCGQHHQGSRLVLLLLSAGFWAFWYAVSCVQHRPWWLCLWYLVSRYWCITTSTGILLPGYQNSFRQCGDLLRCGSWKLLGHEFASFDHMASSTRVAEEIHCHQWWRMEHHSRGHDITNEDTGLR